MGNLGAPEVSLKKTWVLGEPKRSNSLLLLQIFAESKPCAHVCTALDLPCFRHVALQNSGWKGEKASPLPSHPVIAATPPLLAPGARYPGPRFTAVTYSLARRCPPCGDLGGVGRGGGGRRCVSGDIGAPLKERSGPPAPLRRPSGPRLPPPPGSSRSPPVSALVGRSRTLPRRRSPLQVSPRDLKPQGSRSRAFRRPKPPFREA